MHFNTRNAMADMPFREERFGGVIKGTADYADYTDLTDILETRLGIL